LNTGSIPPYLGSKRDFIERMGTDGADAIEIGNPMTESADMESGDERSLRVSGALHDVGQPQARMENMVYGYVTLEALAGLGEEPFYK